MSKRCKCAPTILTEFGEMYLRDGLFFVPFRSWCEDRLLVMSPKRAVDGALAALKLLHVKNINDMREHRRSTG